MGAHTTGEVSEGGRPKSFTRLLTIGARIMMGLIFFVFGLNGFLHFIPQPKEMPEVAGEFFGALMKTGYFLPLMFGTQLLVGVLLLLNRFVPLALALIAPVVVNIFLFHLFFLPPRHLLAFLL